MCIRVLVRFVMLVIIVIIGRCILTTTRRSVRTTLILIPLTSILRITTVGLVVSQGFMFVRELYI